MEYYGLLWTMERCTRAYILSISRMLHDEYLFATIGFDANDESPKVLFLLLLIPDFGIQVNHHFVG